MKQIFLDTETTGLYPDQGHRVIEIAAVEIFNRRPTQRSFHQYLNPDREIDIAAQEVHGISLDFLQDKPHFESVANDLIQFVKGAELIIHNAPFDVGFLNAEFGRIGLMPITAYCDTITDTLKMAKEMRPGQRNNLDALCRFYGIDNTMRTLHGALLDAELLAEVYMAMTRGQDSLLMDLEPSMLNTESMVQIVNESSKFIKVLKADEEEEKAHLTYLNNLNASQW
jgi:DNA polymerase III subunit epsilon